MSESTKAEPKVRSVKQISMREHAKKRSMWAGSKAMQKTEYPLLFIEESGEKVFRPAEVKYPPVLLKIIDEIIVNAIDHHVLNPTLVKEIKISIDEVGMITVYNNGPGIHVALTKNLNGVEMYTVQLIFGEFMAGSNFDDTEDRIVGGQNGIGSKLTVVYSDIFTVETLDSTTDTLYKQSFKQGLQQIDAPELSKAPKGAKSYTKISFLPTYEADFKIKIADYIGMLTEMIRTRAWFAAAYVNAKVWFNNELIQFGNFEKFCQMFTDNLVLHTKMTNTKKPDEYPWDVCFAVSEGKSRQVSIINGVYPHLGGTHIQHIERELIANLKDRVEKEIKKSGVKFNKNYITNNVFIFMRGSIPSPEFPGQTKEMLGDDIDKFASYQIDAGQWKKIWDLLEPAILGSFLKKQLGEIKTRANRGKVDVPKYKEAKYCRDAKKCHQCGLVVTEGDSATGTADTGLLAKASPNFNYDWFGVFSIGGVPVNGFKESSEIKRKASDDTAVGAKPIIRANRTPAPSDAEESESDVESGKTKATAKTTTAGGKAKVKPVVKAKAKPKPKLAMRSMDDSDIPPKRRPNTKLTGNERITSLIKVLGLDFNKTYAMNEIGDKEWKTLRYGFIVGLTDQDLDGFNIYGLIATFIMTYWPALLGRGFLRRIITPVVRAYPKNKNRDKVKEFYSEREVRAWAETLDVDIDSMYTLKYYKGLGTHNQAYKEVTQMFKNIDSKIKTYVFDEDAFKNMIIYYGDDTAPRKKALADPFIEEPRGTLQVPISEQFKIDTKAFQRDNIVRKLLSMVDGFVSSRRKVFFVARKNGRNTIKVQGLAGKAVSDANYHHGEASLEQTIIRMAQAYPMARNLPLLLPHGNFGSRGKGYKDAAASRYIYTVINHNLADKLFRKEDDYILEYEMDDGIRYEPKYYVPIIPYVLCEDNQLPATGWKISIYARDIKAIFKNVRAMIHGKIEKCEKLPPWCNHFKGEIVTWKKRSYYVGVFEWLEEENAIHITELPPGSYSSGYLKGTDDAVKKNKGEKKGIQAKEWVDDFEDKTTEDGVDIMIYLKPGAYEAITAEDSKYGNEKFDAFTEYFELKEPIHHLINLVNENHEVVEYTTYESVFDDWFRFRKNLYAVRVEREIILTNLEIKMLENMQRFSSEHDSLDITKKTKLTTAISKLSKAKYDVFNHTLLENPRFTNLKELVELITEEKHGASYTYLLRMGYFELVEEGYNKRAKQIEDLKDRLRYLQDDEDMFVGAKIWLKELDELETSIRKGIETKWFYGENNYNFE